MPRESKFKYKACVDAATKTLKNIDPGGLLKEACGELQTAQINFESSVPEGYEYISIETLNPILAGLLDVDPEDSNFYGPKVVQLLRDLSEDNLSLLTEVLSQAEGTLKNLSGGLCLFFQIKRLKCL
jgi:hypothetical protein